MNEEIIIAELTGLPIRRLNRDRLLKSGERICNKFGQELWTLEGFHPKGVRLIKWPHNVLCDYTWETLYKYYERVPADEKPAIDRAATSAEGEATRQA